jgi:hypothetical protein
MTTQYVINKGLSTEFMTIRKDRAEHLLSMRPLVWESGKLVIDPNGKNPYTLSETKNIVSHQDFVDAAFPVNGICAFFRQFDSGFFKFASLGTSKQSYTSIKICIGFDNIDDMLNLIYINNSQIEHYKTISGAKKFILKKLNSK